EVLLVRPNRHTWLNRQQRQDAQALRSVSLPPVRRAPRVYAGVLRMTGRRNVLGPHSRPPARLVLRNSRLYVQRAMKCRGTWSAQLCGVRLSTYAEVIPCGIPGMRSKRLRGSLGWSAISQGLIAGVE